MNIVQRIGLLGRTSRTTLITWLVGVVIAEVILAFLFSSRGSDTLLEFARFDQNPSAVAFDVVAGILLLVFQVRRFHDQNRPGWLALTPYALFLAGTLASGLGALLLPMMLGYLVALFLPPTVGPNRFGRDPRGWKSPEHRAEQDRRLKAGQ